MEFGVSLELGAWCFSARAAPKNILLIIADDVGADASFFYNSTNNGAKLPPTPNLASLASSGVVFANAYANPVCSPTRACLITGRYSFRTGVGDAIAGAGSPQLSSSEFTLPEAMNASGLGYHLAQFGKWHLALAPNSPLNVGGWTNFAGVTAGAIANYTNWTKTVNGSQTANYTNYATTDVVNDAVSWIQARGTNPWLAWVAFNAGHTPLHKPPTNLAPHYASLSGTQNDINNNPANYFDAMIEAMDTEIGRLLAAVNLTNTHVIFLGDNGSTSSTLQPPYPSGHGKSTLYEGGIKVPMIIAGPEVVNPNRTNTTLVHAVDLFATILELAGTSVGATVPAGVTIDSHSVVSALQGQTDTSRRVYVDLFGDNILNSQDGRSLRDARYKLIRLNTGTNQFYDLQTDPYENTNLLSGALTAEQKQYYDRLEFWFYGYSTNTGPRIASAAWTNGQFSCTLTQAASYALWRCDDLSTTFWSQVTNAVATTNGSTVTLKDISPPTSRAFYSVVK
ncbi:MAG: sulfatase [Pedosphaera sp.]|nr:sulfatase [Pedosphaera sp.]